ncbi:MAG: hypothetical protein ABIJ85_02205 [bacterium]|nr:hypothetical protein [Patescibacteria group bacterium]
MRKYVLTQDVGSLMSKWASQRGFIIPDGNYFQSLTEGIVADLQLLFDKYKRDVKVVVILAQDLIEKMKRKLALDEDDFIVSLDRAYFDSHFYLEVNRVVKNKKAVWCPLGEAQRPGAKSPESQIEEAVRMAGGKKIVLIDDGCWTGDSAMNIIGKIIAKGGSIKKVIFGILVERDNLSFGVPTQSIFSFHHLEIMDWICERDFVPGTPLGGRTVLEQSGERKYNIGAYYLYGMGDLINWASLDFPEKDVKSYSKKCIYRALDFFQKTEALSGKRILLQDVSRIPFNLRKSDPQIAFIDALEEVADKLISDKKDRC